MQYKPLIMGILNVTPDSFSDGGQYCVQAEALAHAQRMVLEGADIIDIGGESTRPGSDPVSEGEQLARVIPVIQALRCHLPSNLLLSIDTTRSAVAEAAIVAGANVVNDVSAGTDDPRMFSVAARAGVPLVLMHMQGRPKNMQDNPGYRDVVEEVLTFLVERAEAAKDSGIRPENIIIDPGIGFGKRKEDNLRLIADLRRFVATGYKVLLGASRKKFMGAICGETRPVELMGATIATTVLGVSAGVSMFRVHDVKPNRQAADVTAAVLRT
ncbi:dihydropteroate synthase [Methylocaldum sp.]|uniref:dihydropteroate synthase n=1 Tax=Methylocaldum sp. TaxID=1969727 RepID=UPI002D256DF9|nr:dihydropteroate synthase [Methylocaldum sp.]HYE37136.1 dihydropteroate synthase [Methylocaldum sp.]